jgi:hypothetical protein
MKKIVQSIALLVTQLLALACVAVLIVGLLNSIFHWNLTLRLGPPGSPYLEMPTNFIDLAGVEGILIVLFGLFYTIVKFDRVKALVQKHPQITAGIGILIVMIGAGWYTQYQPQNTYDDLLRAVLNNKPAEVAQLVKEVPVETQHSAALFEAALFNSPAIISTLVQAGYDINARNAEGISALDIAEELQNTELIDLLIKNGALKK